jgi:hypothetical protein
MRNFISWCCSLRGATSAGVIVLLAGVAPLAAASFSKVLVPELPIFFSLTSGSLAWGDYDNDNQLDTLDSVTLLLHSGDGSGKPHESNVRLQIDSHDPLTGRPYPLFQ